MRRFLTAALLWIGAALAQAPGTPAYTVAGGLQCGVRVNGGTQVQAWCFTLDGSTLLYNAIAAVPTVQIGAAFEYYYPLPPGTSISWLVWRDNSGIHYQAFTCLSSGPCGSTVQTGIIQ